MDAKRLDAIAQELSTISTRRMLLRLVAALLPVGALATLLEAESASGNGAWVGGGGRRRRRRRDHHRRRHGKHKKKNKGDNCDPACTCATCDAETPCPEPCLCHGTATGGTCSTACIPTGEGLCFVSGECCDFDNGAVCDAAGTCCLANGTSCASGPCCSGLTCCPGIDICLTQCPS